MTMGDLIIEVIEATPLVDGWDLLDPHERRELRIKLDEIKADPVATRYEVNAAKRERDHALRNLAKAKETNAEQAHTIERLEREVAALKARKK